jgi:flavin reductase (DIM6/NTAB) family NADH-FMN oxidoreductase RutF
MSGESMMLLEANRKHMTVDPEELRMAMRHWATGVTVVTAVFNGVRHGMTVNSFTSISLSPPQVLVSLERQTRTHGLVEQAGFFGVTILNSDQQDISDCFAGRHTEVEDRFSNVETYTLVTGAEFISNGLAGFDCRVISRYEAGTHTLFIGEVLAIQIDSQPAYALQDTGDHPESIDPLLYFNRAYRRLQK